MPTRPAIPAETRREILFESRHRCAVCCYPLTLEMAHVVPWRETQDHSPENLIALCPNCHTLADQQGWGAEYLRRYKMVPCGLAGNLMPPMTPAQKLLIETILGANPDDLSPAERTRLAGMFAAYLGITPSSVDILTVKPIASARVLMRLRADAAMELVAASERQDPRLFSMLKEFELRAVVYRGTLRFGFDARSRSDVRFDLGFRPNIGTFTSGAGGTIGLLEQGFWDEFSAYVDGIDMAKDIRHREPFARVFYEVQRDAIRGEVSWELPFQSSHDSLEVQLRLVGERGQQLLRTPVRRVDPRSGHLRFDIPLSKSNRRHAADVTAKIRLAR